MANLQTVTSYDSAVFLRNLILVACFMGGTKNTVRAVLKRYYVPEDERYDTDRAACEAHDVAKRSFTEWKRKIGDFVNKCDDLSKWKTEGSASTSD